MGSLLKAPPLCVIGPAILGEQALTLTGDGAYLVNKKDSSCEVRALQILSISRLRIKSQS